jgi:polysaccharide chain length determinant protein (PEP-CTERM system associated)
MYNSTQPSQLDAETEPISVMMREYWGGIVRRKWVVMASILSGILIGVALCLVLPKSYRSSTEILIENQKIPDEYVKGIGRGNIEERLMMIQEQVMSRAFLSPILEEFKLYEGLVRRDGVESAIEKLRNAINVDTVGTSGSVAPKKKAVEAITISFADEDPMTAMKVTAKLASLFIEENLKDREQLVMGVSVFLEQELQDAKKALEAQEQAISEYKTKFVGLLPEQMETNLRTLDRLQMELNATNDALHSRTDKVNSLERSIKEYQASLVTRGVEPDDPRFVRKEVDPLLTRLRQLEQRLTTLRAEWKETYPDISDTKQEIVSLKEQLVERYGPSFVDQGGALEGQENDAVIRKNPLPDLYLRELKTQHNDLVTEISSLNSRRDRLVQLIKGTERRVEQVPAREQELSVLVRDYENRQKNYQTLREKQLNAHVAVNLEKRQKGEQFRILDPANLPEKLESPNRPLIMVLGLLGGCGVGIALVFGLEQFNPTFRRREEVELLPGVRVLATVPWFVMSSNSKPNNTGLGIPVLRDGGSSSGGFAGSSMPSQALVAKWQPESIAAEQYRMAATRIVLSTERRRSTAIEITSALESEGKTTTVVNLGYTIARDLGRRTVLIDCDFRRPALHQFVGMPARAGLLHLLDGEASVDDCLSMIDDVSCSVITVGRSDRATNELVRIEQLKELLPQLRAKFQYLLINTPPVLASATMGILASVADEIVMVIKAGSSPQHVVQKAFTALNLTGEKHVVLNGVDEQSLPHYLYGYSMPYRGEALVEGVPR